MKESKRKILLFPAAAVWKMRMGGKESFSFERVRQTITVSPPRFDCELTVQHRKHPSRSNRET